MQLDKLRQWHMWQRMSWVQLPTQFGPHAQRPMKVSMTRQVAWNVNGNVHNFRAKSGISCLTTRSCATKSAGSYSIVDRLSRTTASAQQSRTGRWGAPALMRSGWVGGDVRLKLTRLICGTYGRHFSDFEFSLLPNRIPSHKPLTQTTKAMLRAKNINII